MTSIIDDAMVEAFCAGMGEGGNVRKGLNAVAPMIGAKLAKETIDQLRKELFSLCEDTEDRYRAIDIYEGKQGAFRLGTNNRGQINS
jgi:hypothetical protein